MFFSFQSLLHQNEKRPKDASEINLEVFYYIFEGNPPLRETTQKQQKGNPGNEQSCHQSACVSITTNSVRSFFKFYLSPSSAMSSCLFFLFLVSVPQPSDRRALDATLDFLDAGHRIVPLVASKSLGEGRGGGGRGRKRRCGGPSPERASRGQLTSFLGRPSCIGSTFSSCR